MVFRRSLGAFMGAGRGTNEVDVIRRQAVARRPEAVQAELPREEVEAEEAVVML
jgi:hypothetical protein